VLVSAAVWCHDPCVQQGPKWLHDSSAWIAASAQGCTQKGKTFTRCARSSYTYVYHLAVQLECLSTWFCLVASTLHFSCMHDTFPQMTTRKLDTSYWSTSGNVLVWCVCLTRTVIYVEHLETEVHHYCEVPGWPDRWM